VGPRRSSLRQWAANTEKARRKGTHVRAAKCSAAYVPKRAYTCRARPKPITPAALARSITAHLFLVSSGLMVSTARARWIAMHGGLREVYTELFRVVAFFLVSMALRAL